MKLQGKTIDKALEVLVPIVRSDDGDGDFYFLCVPVLDYEPFNQACPVPKPPMIVRPGKPQAADPTDKKFLKLTQEHAEAQTHWMILESIKGTPGLEFETVDMSNPETWPNYETETAKSGLSEGEIARVINGVIEANGLDDSKVEVAKKRFLAIRQEQASPATTLPVVPPNTESGGHVKD